MAQNLWFVILKIGMVANMSWLYKLDPGRDLDVGSTQHGKEEHRNTQRSFGLVGVVVFVVRRLV